MIAHMAKETKKERRARRDYQSERGEGEVEPRSPCGTTCFGLGEHDQGGKGTDD